MKLFQAKFFEISTPRLRRHQTKKTEPGNRNKKNKRKPINSYYITTFFQILCLNGVKDELITKNWFEKKTKSLDEMEKNWGGYK